MPSYAQFHTSQLKLGVTALNESEAEGFENTSYFVEYEKPILRHFSVSATGYYTVHGPKIGKFDPVDHVMGSLNLVWVPVRGYKRSIKVGYGFAARYDQNGSDEIKINADNRVNGRNWTLAYERRVGRAWALGLRGTWHRFKTDHDFSGVGLTVGFKL